MKKPQIVDRLCLLSFCAVLAVGLPAAEPSDDQRDPTPALAPLAWPTASRPETKPWAWWWWQGSAVTKADITANLESLQRDGIGGVVITCLRDVRDPKAVKLRFLSKEWIEAIAHAVREAHRLGMDADLSPVPGWAFGGPWVTYDDACAMVATQRLPLDECRKNGMRIATFQKKADRRNLSAVVAQSADGAMIDLTTKVDDDGVLRWTAPAGTWTLYTAISRSGSSRVQAPTPDGGGWAVDHLSAEAMKRYFEPFDRAFSMIDRRDLPRAFFNDSWEVDLDWTWNFPAEFAKRRGYDLRQQLPAFMGEGDSDTVARVAYDYRHTLSDLMLDVFTRQFHAWASGYGRRITCEVIHEPTNDLDAYALYDIPNADMGGPLEWYVQNGRLNLDRPKMAASPAHILGHALVASETLTCYGPILDTTMTRIKDKLDVDMLGGINHAQFHGIAYSPVQARWPGWLFYAGTHLGPMNPLWRLEGLHLCRYITRCQSFLQAGQADDDLLIYLPIHDIWSRRAKGKRGPPGIAVATVDAVPPVTAVPTAKALWHRGYDFALVSDRLLESIDVKNGRLVSPGGSYRALVIADCQLMPATTLERIAGLAEKGGIVIFPGKAPADVPGFSCLAERRDRFRATMQRIVASAQPVADDIREAKLGKGRVIFGGSATEALARAHISRETMFDSGLLCIRRVDDAGTTYFVLNPAWGKRVNGWVPLNAAGASVVLFDPVDGRVGVFRHRCGKSGGVETLLQLDPRESCILRVLKAPVAGPAWTYLDAAGEPIAINGPWQVRFLEGGETIPHPETVASLTSWTTWPSDQIAALRGFSGVARYTTRFSMPVAKADDWTIDLGEVLHTARVRLNGIVLGDRFATPMRVLASSALKAGDNLLEIEVANSAINRAADLDLKGIEWLKTADSDSKSCDIGDFLFPYQKKDAATWQPRPSGLLGPVRLIPMEKK